MGVRSIKERYIKCKKRLYTTFILITDFLVLTMFRCLYLFTKNTKTTTKKTLLILRLDALGDHVIWLDTYNTLYNLYPVKDYNYILVCNEYCKELYENDRRLKEIIAIERKEFVGNLVYRVKVMQRIYTSNVSIVLNPMYSREFLLSDSIVRFSKASTKIGFIGDLNNITFKERKLSNEWYTELIQYKDDKAMELERNAEFVRHLGLHDFEPSLSEWPLPVLPSSHSSYYVICPGSSRNIKKWPPSYFARISDFIYSRTGLNGVICGGEEESYLAEEIMNYSSAPLKNRMGQTSIQEFGSLISHSQFVVSNDSSAIHISVSLNVPSICIVGGFHPERFLPYPMKFKSRHLPIVIQKKWNCFGCNWNCIYNYDTSGPAPCVRDITVEEVIEQVQLILKEEVRIV